MDAEGLSFDPQTTALILVDIQNFSVAMDLQPVSGGQVLATAARLADACRRAGIPVVLVRVGHDDNLMPHPSPKIDASFGAFQMPPGAKDVPAELGPKRGDIVVDKYNWGAFYGTNLDSHLRRRGIRTLIVGGITTNIGVDTTMRQAHERGYDQVLVEDAVAATTLEEHAYTLKFVSPRLSRVRKADEVLGAIARAAA